MAEKLFQVGVKALIRNDKGEILLLNVDPSIVRNSRGPYYDVDIPGGRIEEGDDVLGTLKKEVFEETGISSFDDCRFFTAVVSVIEIPISSTQNAGLVLMVYEVRVSPFATLKLSQENVGYEWVTPKEAAKRLVTKYPAEFSERIMSLQ